MPFLVPRPADGVDAVVGVDTHTDTHTAAVVSPVGSVLAELTVPATAAGVRTLLTWAGQHTDALGGAGVSGPSTGPGRTASESLSNGQRSGLFDLRRILARTNSAALRTGPPPWFVGLYGGPVAAVEPVC